MTPKQKLRQTARLNRLAFATAQPDFAAAIARHADVLGVMPGMIVGGYHALPEEADPALLLAKLVAMGAAIAFPRVAGKGRALDYHRVPDGAVMSPGTHGIHEPSPDWPRVIPSLLLVPLLAFDAAGHRLGYGGGFYDRTLEALKIPAIGIAFAGQAVASLPVEAHDRRLDGILTEHGLKRFS